MTFTVFTVLNPPQSANLWSLELLLTFSRAQKCLRLQFWSSEGIGVLSGHAYEYLSLKKNNIAQIHIWKIIN